MGHGEAVGSNAARSNSQLATRTRKCAQHFRWIEQNMICMFFLRAFRAELELFMLSFC